MTAAASWDLDPNVTHLNHGSFGAAPRRVLEAQNEWRRTLESNPMAFFSRRLYAELDAARDRLASFIGADPATLVFVPNASSGVNAVLRSLSFAAGDEILVTNHGYGAASNAAAYVAERSGATLVTAEIPMPVTGPGEVVRAIAASISPNTKLAVVDHITSATGLVWPIASIVELLAARSVPALVDGAHAPGMVDLDVASIGAAFYTGNCHKWMCAPKGAAFLVTAPEYAADLVPTVVGWGRTSVPPGKTQYHAHFDWVGTDDPTPYLSIPAAIDTIAALSPDGWPGIRRHNHELVLEGAAIAAAALRVSPASPESMTGSMAVVPLPPAPPGAPLEPDPLQLWLATEAHIEVSVTRGPDPVDRWLRLSAHAYNGVADYERLAEALGVYVREVDPSAHR